MRPLRRRWGSRRCPEVSAFGAGELAPFALTYAPMAQVSRQYRSIGQIQQEVFMARIWGGVHFRTSNEVGDALGEKIGDYVLHAAFAPAAPEIKAAAGGALC